MDLGRRRSSHGSTPTKAHMISKAVLGSHIFIKKSEIHAIEAFKRRLVVYSKYDDLYVDTSVETETALGIPLYHPLATSILEQAQKVIDIRPQGQLVNFRMTSTPRPHQVPIVAEFMKLIAANARGIILQLHTGGGKTWLMLRFLSTLRTPALIVVPREFIVEQWHNMILQHTNLLPSDIGIAQQDRCEYKGKKIVIGMVHSLCKNKYPDEFKKYFGAIVFDELHLLGADTFSEVTKIYPAKYRLGTTATLDRKDNRTDVYLWSVGQHQIRVDKKHDYKPTVIRVRYTGIRSELPSYLSYVQAKVRRMGVILSFIAEDTRRNRMLVSYIGRMLRKCRRVLVLSHRIGQLQVLQRMLIREGVNPRIMGVFTQSTPERDRKRIVEDKQLVLACVSEDVECLTLDGWKKYNDLIIGEPIATYNMQSKHIEYQPLLDVVSYAYDGDLCRIDRRRCNVLMTWNHRNIVRRSTKSLGRRVRKEIIVRADELTRNDKIRIMAPVDYPEGESVGSTALAELIGWIIAEGTYPPYPRSQTYGIVLYQNKGPNARRIDELLKIVGLSVKREEYRPGQLSWSFDWWSSKRIKELCPDKALTKELVSIPLIEAEALFRGLVHGDGHTRKDDGRISFIQKVGPTLDWFTILAMRLGYSPKVASKSCGMGVVYLMKADHVGLNDHTFHVVPEQYTGKVWCPKTANGTWVAKSKGSIFVTGNTYQIFSMAIDSPNLDALVLATPQADVKQAVGRVMRTVEGKKAPIVVDVVDDLLGDTIGWGKARLKLWKEMDSTIVEATSDGRLL